MAFFLPTRKGSERVRNKNIRPFAGIQGGLMENKIRQLVATKSLDEIILSTNDEACMDIASKYASDGRVRIIPRPEELCLSSTNLQDLICYVPTITDAEHILWGHVTTPLAGAQQYDEGIGYYYSKLGEGYDSLVGVTELRNFLLNRDGVLVNNTTGLPWPRTQDLEPLYEINHTMFIARREVYTEQRNRIGRKPLLYVMDKIHSFDIDWEDDFSLTEIIYKNINVIKQTGGVIVKISVASFAKNKEAA